MEFYGKSDIGKKRATNQDSFVCRQIGSWTLCVVCDGMGGMNGGNIASALAIEAFTASVEHALTSADFTESRDTMSSILSVGVSAANDAVLSRAQASEELQGMGTTLIAALCSADTLYAVNVGDSRLYRIAPDGIEQITRDHSYVQLLLDMGQITAEEALTSPNKNIITRAVGTERNTEADFFTLKLRENDLFLLCSDGLTNYLSDAVIADILSDSVQHPLRERVDALIDGANEGGGGDNITAVVLECHHT